MNRTTIMLKAEQATTITSLANSLDVDQGKAIRWIINTITDISTMHDQVEYKTFRDTLKPQAKYLLDTLSSIVSK